MKAKIEFKQTRDFGEIISDCIVFILQNWKSLIKTYFVFCGFFMVGTVIFSALQRLKMVNYQNQIAEGQLASPYSMFGFEYGMVLLFVFLNLVSATLTTLCYIALYTKKGNQPPTISEVWGYFKYYFLRVAWHFLLLSIILLVAFVIDGIIVAAISSGLSNPLVSGVIIFLFVLIPAIYLMTIFSVFFPIVIAENAGFGYAFSKCFKLVKGRWWSTFGVIVISLLIVYAGFLLIAIPFSVVTRSSVFFVPYNASLWLSILYVAIVGLYQVFNILPMSASAVTYYSYAEDKENTGLLERIDTLGSVDENTELGNEAY